MCLYMWTHDLQLYDAHSSHLKASCNIHILVPQGRKLPGPALFAHPAGNTPPRIDFLPHRRDASPWFPCKPVLNALNALRRHQLPNRLQIVELEPPCIRGVQASKMFKPAGLVFEGSFLLFSLRHFCRFFRGVQVIPAGNCFLLRQTGNVRHQPFQPSRTGGGIPTRHLLQLPVSIFESAPQAIKLRTMGRA